MEKIIIGGEGFIGKNLHKKIKALCIDLIHGQNALTCELPKADIVFLLAAQTSVEASFHDPVHDMDNLRIMARIVKEYSGAKIIYTNSCASLNPKSPYGFSKKVAGDYLMTFHKNWVNLILPNIYGEGSKSVVDLFRGEKLVTVYGNGTHIRDYVHVDDVVEGIIKAIDWDMGTYMMGSGIGTSVLELAKDKSIFLGPERQEESAIVLQNTTPNWQPTLNVLEYMQ